MTIKWFNNDEFHERKNAKSVKKSAFYALVDDRRNQITEAKYEFINDFQPNSLAVAGFKGRQGIIDKREMK